MDRRVSGYKIVYSQLPTWSRELNLEGTVRNSSRLATA
jgi:hypothetical protein